MLSLAAAFLIPLFSVLYIISVFLVYNIISYIKQKPEANQSTFDIATLHLAWYQFICYFLNNSYTQGGPRLLWVAFQFFCAYKFSTVHMISNNIFSFERQVFGLFVCWKMALIFSSGFTSLVSKIWCNS